jgi:hypothetical protein
MASERPKHVATPNVYCNIILVLCLSDSSVDILLTITTSHGRWHQMSEERTGAVCSSQRLVLVCQTARQGVRELYRAHFVHHKSQAKQSVQ